MSEFFVGQKVICLNSEWENANPIKRIIEDFFGTGGPNPSFGGHYEVAGFEYIKDKEYLLLKEFAGLDSWHSTQFRPLESKSVSIFRKIALDVTEGRKVELV